MVGQVRVLVEMMRNDPVSGRTVSASGYTHTKARNTISYSKLCSVSFQNH